MNRTPFYPCQTVSGETYVVDGRNGQIASVVSCSFDTSERWHVAKLRARRMNDDYVHALYAVRQRLAFGCLGFVIVLFAIEVASGDLSRIVGKWISAFL